jgi:pyrroline-5-carboxylate reductase
MFCQGQSSHAPMQLGFVGTGEITSAMVTGLSSSDAEPHSIRLSPRNLEVATDLANRFRNVSIASSNQDVLDHCDTVMIAVRPQVARSVLSELRFRPEHCAISVVSALSLLRVSEFVVPATRITRAVPLPSTAQRIGPTAIYPTDRFVEDLFAATGTVFAVETEGEFDAICAATATIASLLCIHARGCILVVPKQRSRREGSRVCRSHASGTNLYRDRRAGAQFPSPRQRPRNTWRHQRSIS